MSFIYLDHAATTKCDERVFEKMTPFFEEKFGNPSSLHQKGREARKAVDEARGIVAGHFGVSESEVIFTGSGTEADFLAVKGIWEKEKEQGKNKIVTSVIEHRAILNLVDALEKQGAEIVKIGVDERGRIDLDELEKVVDEKTAVVSIAVANSEIGTRQDLKKIGEICREKKVWFHSDAVQLVGKEEIKLDDFGLSALSLSAHKFYGPKGVGALIVKKEVPLTPQILGGGQEKRRRAATENVPGIVGLAEALKLAESEVFGKMEEVGELRDHLVERVLEEIPESVRNGDPENCLSTHAHFSFPKVEGESLLLRLDLEGICGSTGSACSAGSLEPSHVLVECGLGAEMANSSLRLSLGKETTLEEVDECVEILKKVVRDLREMSAL